MAAGLFVSTSQPRPVLATGPTPGTISTVAGGGLGSGPATSVGQSTGALAVFGGKLYEADQSHYVVRVIDLATTDEQVFAGTGHPGVPSGDGGLATAASIGTPWAIAVNSAGDVYIATATNVNNDPGNLVRKVDHSTGVITTVAGGGSSFSDGVAATSSSIGEVSGLAFNSSGDLFIADLINNRVRKVDHGSGVISTVAGTGSTVYNGDGHLATATNITFPGGVVFDSSDNMFITSFDARLLKVDRATQFVSTAAGDGTNSPPGCSSGAVSSSFQGGHPTFDHDGNLMFTGYNCVFKIVSGSYVLVAGNGTDTSTGDGGLATAAGVGQPVNAVSDSAGNIYVSQGAFYYVVRKIDHSTSKIDRFAGTGQQCGHAGDGGQATAAEMCSMYGIALDPSGDIFISDSVFDVVRKVTPGGVISTVAGNGTAGLSGDGGAATAAQLKWPAELATNSSGDLFIADTGNNRIRMVDHATGFISTYVTTSSAPAGLVVDAGGNLFFADGLSLQEKSAGGTISTRATFNGGVGALAMDAMGNFFGIGGGTGVFELPAAGGFTSLLPNSLSGSPGIALGPTDQVVISSGNSVGLVLNGRLAVGMAGGGGGGDGGPARNAFLQWVGAITSDSTGDIYIADAGTQSVRRVQAYLAPGSPTSVHASVAGPQLNVSWTSPANDGGLPIIEYDVTRHNGARTTTAQVTGSPAGTSTSFGGSLPFHTANTFTVKASNGWDASTSSAPSNVLVLLPASGYITTYAGTLAQGTGIATAIGQAPFSIGLEQPTVWVGDAANPSVRSLNPFTLDEGVLAGNDVYGYTGDGGAATSASIGFAGAIADCGPAAPVWVADTPNFRIRQLRGTASTVIGTGVPGFSGDGGLGTSAQIGEVYGLACTNPLGGLWIADSTNGAIRLWDPVSNVITLQWTGFHLPTGIFAIDSQNLVVADSATNLVWLLDNSTGGSCVVAGNVPASIACDTGTGPKTALKRPWGLAWDGTNLYIAEEGANRVRSVSFTSGDIITVAGTGVAGFSGDGGPATSAMLNAPFNVVWTGNTSDLYVADYLNFRVRDINLPGGPGSGTISTIAGNGSPSFYGEAINAVDAQLGNPYAVAGDSAGNDYFVDNFDNSVRKIDATGVVTTIAGRPTAVPGFSGDGGAATSAQLNDPRGVAVDSSGNVFITDTGNNRIRRVDHSTGFISSIAGPGNPGVNSPRGVAVDAAGNVYVADTGSNSVKKWDHLSSTLTTIAGNGVAGYSGDGGPAINARLNGPRGVAVNATGDVFISDTGNNVIRKVDHTTGWISTIAGSGQVGAGGDGGPATRASLSFPFGLAFDVNGNLLIADTGNQSIRMIDALSGKISSLVGSCGSVAGFSGDGGPAVFAEVNFPYGVAVDGAGNILVADTSNNRIRATRGPALQRETCASHPGSPGPRGVNPTPPGSPGPRLVDQGSRQRLAVALAATPAVPSSQQPSFHPPAQHHAVVGVVRRPPTAGGRAKTTRAVTGIAAGAKLPAAQTSSPKPAGSNPSAVLLLIAIVPVALLWMRRRRWRRTRSY